MKTLPYQGAGLS